MNELDIPLAQQINHLEHPPDAIHRIQPHGFLLVLETTQFEILQVSANTTIHLGLAPEELLGRSLCDLLDAVQFQAFRDHLPQRPEQRTRVSLSFVNQSPPFQGSIYQTADSWVLELEPTGAKPSSRAVDIPFQISEAMTQMKQATDLDDLFQSVVAQIQSLTEFERVMIYQFDQQGAGEVVAEQCLSEPITYRGLHFPAFDIPAASRELYRMGELRFIPDMTASWVPLVPAIHSPTQEPLDLQRSTLREVDPCCVTYHQNIGATALLIAPLCQDQTLWGLITCHHPTAKYLAPQQRTFCELIAQIAATEIENKLHLAELVQQTRLHTLSSDVIEAIATADNFIDALLTPELRLLHLVNAQGAAVCLGDEMTLLGQTPSLAQIQALRTWAAVHIPDELFQTRSLAQVYPAAADFTATGSGLLFLRIAKAQGYEIYWFRPEIVQTVNWGGNPNESIQLDAQGQPQLSPRNSFARWQETVRHTAETWHGFEIHNALDLRNALVGLVFRKAEELAQLNLELQQSNRELGAFAYAAAHDLKEPLRGIYNYANIVLEDYSNLLDTEGQDYLADIQAFTQRMETLINALLRISQLRQTKLERQTTDLNELLQNAVEVIRASRPDRPFELRLPRSLPTLNCDPTLVQEVFRNLISNALKYNLQADPWVEVGYRMPSERHSPIFYIQDNGIGMRTEHLTLVFKLFKRLHPQEQYGGGAGVGLAIVNQIIERHGGRIWVESIPEQGSTFHFMLSST
ncbi:MAG: GAF domain-containing protein [Spirulina sp. SIO3F2]|nr:GAF domain-containing protein [Spirulina sp. SIO3F2]